MCMVVYVASDRALPEIPWDEQNPRLNVQAINDTEVAIKTQFSKMFAYFFGAHTSCSCGFFDDDPDSPDGLRSIQQLRDYLSDALKTVDELELFSCWDGDEGKEPATKGIATLQDIRCGFLKFDERSFLVIRSNT